jgi:cystathionine beta-lyase/cystathionine gamma-synthase
MTHADIDPAERERLGITPGLARISVGVEHFEDLIADVAQALDAVGSAGSKASAAARPEVVKAGS